MHPSRIAFISALTLASLAAHGQLTDEALKVKVSYDSLATSARKVVSDLSAASKVKMDVTNAFNNDVLVMSVTDVPLNDVMTKIATATSGEWKLEEDTYRLVRSPGVANQEAREVQAKKVEALRKELTTLFDELKPKTGKDAQAQARIPGGGMFGGGAGGAVRKAIIKFLQFVDINLIASLEDGKRVVLSSNPTIMQRPLGGNVSQVISDMVAEHNKSVAQNQNERQADLDSEEMQQVTTFLKQLGIDLEERPVNGRPAKALLILSAGGSMLGGTTAELRLYDQDGKVVLTDTVMLDAGSMMEGIGEMVESLPAGTPGLENLPKKERPKVGGPDKDLEFTKTTQELESIFGNGMMMGMGGAQSAPKPSAELEEKLLRPDLYDPLSFSQSEALIQTAKHKKLNLVANVPDDVASFFSQMAGSSKTVNAFLSRLLANTAVNVNMDASWLTVKPVLPAKARSERFNRAALARLLQASKIKGMPTLDDMAAYAQANRPPMETPAAMSHIMLFAPTLVSRGMAGMQDWDLLRFYGTLSINQKAAAKDGVTISFANLGPNQRPIVERMAFGSEARLEVGPAQEDEPSFLKMMRGFMPGQQSTWKQEPTEVMPSGLPSQGAIRLVLNEGMIGASTEQNAMANMMGSLGPDELALFRFFKEDPNMAQMGGMMPQVNQLRLGTRKTYAFTFQVATDVAMRRTLNDDRIDKNGQVVSMDNLPESFKAQIDKAYASLKKSGFGNLMGIGRQSTPPPTH